MRALGLKAILRTIGTVSVLLIGVGFADAQEADITAAPTRAALPDGSSVPMWGYNCDNAGAGGVSCSALNLNASGSWSPIIITVPTGSDLKIKLSNLLPTPAGATTGIPTSLVIVGQLGGGLGSVGQGCTSGTTCLDSPDHSAAQGSTTWPIAGGDGSPAPNQGKRVQSFSTEVSKGSSTLLTWTAPRPGTYLLESGTHPSIQATMGLIGIVVVTSPAGSSTQGTAYPGVNYDSEVPLLFSEIDPRQNAAVDAAVNTPGFSETKVWSGQPGACGNPLMADGTPNAAYHTCYPPVVNYTPLYYLINGVAFDKTNASASLFPTMPASGVPPLTGKVLVRFVNAGSRMHVPSIVGSTTNSPAQGGFSLIAQDGNLLPGVPRVQSEVFMAAGKTFDVMINAPAVGASVLTTPHALPVYDRELSLSANAISRDSGMLAYIGVNGAALPAAAAGNPTATPDQYSAVVPGQTLTITDPSKGVIANDVNIFGVKATTAPAHGSVSLNADGTFNYTPSADWPAANSSGFATFIDSFSYCGNGATSGAACTTVTFGAAAVESASGITCSTPMFSSGLAKTIKISAPGVLAYCKDASGLPLSVSTKAGSAPIAVQGLTVSVDSDGSFTGVAATAGHAYTFTFSAQNTQGTVGAPTTVTLKFPTGSGLQVTVLDGSDKSTEISDYRWILEEDRTFFVDPNCTTNPLPAGCPGSSAGVVPNFGTNFHTSYMPVIASGCTGDTSCGADQSVLGKTIAAGVPSSPADVALCTDQYADGAHCLDPKKRYYLSVLPGDAAQPFIAGYTGVPDCTLAGVQAGECGHGMGGAPVPKGAHDSSQSIKVLTVPSPYPPATLSVFVFEDDYPLNGEHDAGGGVDVLSPWEPGLGGFQVTLADDAGGTGDATGTPTYDMFNMPLSNALAGTIDPVSKLDACPISPQITKNTTKGDGTQMGITGMIITCPKYESDGKTLSPLAGQVLVKNLYQGRYGVIANPGADRIAAGEEWLQTNTLDGQKAHDSFMRIGEPGYFQEFGPAGYHVTIGFASPNLINPRLTAMCKDPLADCTHEVKGFVTTARMSRTPDERLYGSGTRDSYSFTQCFVSIGDPDGADFQLTKCDADGKFDFKGVPAGNWKITTFDQWNDQVVDGITTPVGMCDPGTANNCKAVVDMKEVAAHQWQSNIYTRTFIDTDFSGVSNDSKPGLPFVDTNIRFRDGSFSNFNNTDLNGYAGFNEVFPLFNWYVIETDSTRFKNTGTHVIYDAGGPVDGSAPGGTACAGTSLSDPSSPKPCGSSVVAQNLANTFEPNPLPADLSVPGAVYCTDADCTGASIAGGPVPSSQDKHSTGRIDPAWVNSYGWQGYSGQNNFLEFGKKPFAEGENGGVHGHVVYASTRPFDDPSLLLQLSWEPLVPHVRINLYKEGVAADGVSQTLSLVDYTDTTSFDDWAQGFRADGKPNMNCPGQGTDTTLMADPYFWFALKDQPQWLDLYNNNGSPTHNLPYDSQYKCYDGMHNWNQLQPAPYDGMYSFPSATGIDAQTGKPTGTNCTICVANPTSKDPSNPSNYDPYRSGTPMLPDGKYVVEVVVPPGYELVKEEDKNILIGDNYIAPVQQQFGALGSIYILPDQASLIDGYNANNPQNSTTNLGRTTFPSKEADTGNVETYWPCVGAERVVPDFISLFPGSKEVAPFAGATRHLCDRKEVTIQDQTSALAKFYVFTETHAAAHFTGVITDDFTAEFDPYSPQFGEKYGPAYLPVSFKDWAGNEITRLYSDAWGAYNGLSYSSWEVNPPNPTGYGPTMMVGCMNDAGPIADPNNPGKMITDPHFQDGYSQFCYELPFMPGQTGYFDTPVVPTSAFAGDYNNPDCAYPDATPAVSEVDGDGVGPWVAGLNGQLTSIALSSGGSSYTSAPAVSLTGGGGTGAAASAVISGNVVAIAVTTPGEYQSSTTPTITLSGGGGSGAQATAVMTTNNRNVFSVSVSNGGSGYTSTPTVTFAAPPCTINGTTCVRATGTSTRNAGTRRITGVNVTNAGAGYTSAPSVSFSGGGGNGAVAAANLGWKVASANVTAAGSGYTTAPTVTFSGAGTNGTTARGTATENASVVAVNITSPGSGYTGNPTVAFTGGGGSGAAASASVETGGKLTITALGDQLVDNYEYSGPSASNAPYNKQKVSRHYGFGSAPTDFTKFGTAPAGYTFSCSGTASGKTLCPYVTVGGQPLTNVAWGDTTITGSVPAGIPACTIQQQAMYGGSTAQCGELSITATNGKQSVDAVTVTVGGSAPKYVAPGSPLTASSFGSIQQAIDTANPGDLIIVPPGTYQEMVLMWKPVRLQGVGAASSVIDANTQPAGKLNPWRQRVVCLFGLGLNGTPISASNPYDPSGAIPCDSSMQFSVDRLPLEATVGWDATLNGNLAEQLIEPTLMGAYEGAGITVLAKGVKFTDASQAFVSDTFPTGTQLLTAQDCQNSAGRNPYPSNFLCNPSSIDGLTVKNSSQGGGGIMVHAWGHDLQIANNRVLNNQGTLSGGITVGQGEHPEAYLVGDIAVTVPGSCIVNPGNAPTNMALPYCFDMDVNVHHNLVTQNSSLGDELFSSTPAGAGGVTFCNGSDYYKFNFNWVCGNMSTGDGAGVAHLGLSYDGDIEYNAIMFNQTTNPTIVTNGGGLLAMGAPDADPPCATTTDVDCVSPPGTILPSDGTGPGLVINANLILGNSADSGSGGGLRLQHINGTDVLNFPNGSPNFLGIPLQTRWPSIPGHQAQPSFQTATPWNAVMVTNNIIANNVAGWDGGGISLQDALATSIVNNTVTTNNSTASSGVLFQTLFAPLASTQGTNCTNNSGAQSCPQPAGLVSVTNSAVLTANISQLSGGTRSVSCPAGNGTNSNTSTANCTKVSVPFLYNDMFWQNRPVMIGVGGLGNGFVNQQNVVTVYNPGFTGTGLNPTPANTQTATGACDASASYWDIGVRGDMGPGNHSSGSILSPSYSVLTNTGSLVENGGGNNDLDNPALTVISDYCNGNRSPVEAVPQGTPYVGWLVPPGTNESNALPAPAFTLMAAATVDEGNNWINLRWGPLSLSVPDPNGKAPFTFNPALIPGSTAIKHIPSSANTAYSAAPNLDYFGNQRKTDNAVDVGAIEYLPPNYPVLSVTPGSLAFGSQLINTSSSSQTLTLTNDGGVQATGIVIGAAPSGFARTTNCTGTLIAGASCTISVTFAPTTATSYSGTLALTAGALTIANAPVNLSGTGATPIYKATVTPSPLAFGTWPTGTTTAALPLTVTNTGNSPLSGGTFTLGGGTPQPFSRVTTGSFPANAPNCGATLAVGASCTVKVQFAVPTTAASFNRTLTVVYGNGATITGSPVGLTGTGTSTRATVSISPNPLAITATGIIPTGTGTVTLTNTSPVGGTSMSVSNVAVNGGGLFSGWAFNALAGADTCTGAALAPGASCTVGVRFTTGSPGTTRSGTIVFTDTGAGSPQTGQLTGK